MFCSIIIIINVTVLHSNGSVRVYKSSTTQTWKSNPESYPDGRLRLVLIHYILIFCCACRLDAASAVLAVVQFISLLSVFFWKESPPQNCCSSVLETGIFSGFWMMTLDVKLYFLFFLLVFSGVEYIWPEDSSRNVTGNSRGGSSQPVSKFNPDFWKQGRKWDALVKLSTSEPHFSLLISMICYQVVFCVETFVCLINRSKL